MRNLYTLKAYRDIRCEVEFFGEPGDATCGLFRLGFMTVLASSGKGWDHASVSLPDRCPTWDEMERVKRLFFKDDETAMQLHVPPADHRSLHPYCLHLRRPNWPGSYIPRPPADMVAPAEAKPC